jgi:PRTRC genetic system protein A
MSAMDDAILTTFPLVAVPPSGNLPPAQADGIRYLVAKSGLWQEINLPWIRVVRAFTGPGESPLPYGELQPVIDLRCGPLPMDLVREFIAGAREAAPLECAAALVWSEDGSWRLAWRQARSAGSGHIDYNEVTLADGEHLVVDMHSHGHHGAFFSRQDNEDERGSMKFSLVVGSFNGSAPTSEMRLCMLGLIRNATAARDGTVQVVFE